MGGREISSKIYLEYNISNKGFWYKPSWVRVPTLRYSSASRCSYNRVRETSVCRKISRESPATLPLMKGRGLRLKWNDQVILKNGLHLITYIEIPRTCLYNGNTSRDYILKGIISRCQPNLTEPEGWVQVWLTECYNSLQYIIEWRVRFINTFHEE